MGEVQRRNSDESLDGMGFTWDLDDQYEKVKRQMRRKEDWDTAVRDTPKLIPNQHCWSKDPKAANKYYGTLKPSPFINLVHNAPIQKQCKAYDVGVSDGASLDMTYEEEGSADNGSVIEGNDGRVSVHYVSRASSPLPSPFFCCISD